MRTLGVLVAGLLLFVFRSDATILTIPASLPQEVLSETVATAFAPNNVTAEDFELKWEGQPLAGAEISLGKHSLQWVRVLDVLVIPRAQFLITVDRAQGGRVTQAAFSQVLEPVAGSEKVHAELPVALISGDKNPIDVVVIKNGREVKSRLTLHFKPRRKFDHDTVYEDPSCSRFRVTADSVGSGPSEWVYLGCRLVYSEGAEHRAASLEVLVFWDGVGQLIQVGGVSTDPATQSVWALRLRSSPGQVQLQAGEHKLLIHYRIPEPLHLASIGAGIGPYYYSYHDYSGSFETAMPMVTLYGSYFVTEAVRVLAFDATAIAKNPYTDFGLYVSSEYFRLIDRRLVVNLMLGGHIMGISNRGQFSVLPGFPQGIEVTYADAFEKGSDLKLGGFVYPRINGEAYVNSWIRWGSRIFIEANFIYWEERIHDQPVSVRSYGLSLGFPVFTTF